MAFDPDVLRACSSSAGDVTHLRVKVTPNAPADRIVGVIDGVAKIKITAAPTDGKANRHLIAFLARQLGVPKSSIEVVKGRRSRNKVLALSS